MNNIQSAKKILKKRTTIKIGDKVKIIRWINPTTKIEEPDNEAIGTIIIIDKLTSSTPGFPITDTDGACWSKEELEKIH